EGAASVEPQGVGLVRDEPEPKDVAVKRQRPVGPGRGDEGDDLASVEHGAHHTWAGARQSPSGPTTMMRVILAAGPVPSATKMTPGRSDSITPGPDGRGSPCASSAASSVSPTRTSLSVAARASRAVTLIS